MIPYKNNHTVNLDLVREDSCKKMCSEYNNR